MKNKKAPACLRKQVFCYVTKCQLAIVGEMSDLFYEERIVGEIAEGKDESDFSIFCTAERFDFCLGSCNLEELPERVIDTKFVRIGSFFAEIGKKNNPRRNLIGFCGVNEVLGDSDS